MGFFNNFPYTNFHEMNVDWILKEFTKLKSYVEQYTAINNVGYAGVWNITEQYPQWSIVTNGENSYLSKKPVPAGIAIDNMEYWLHLADLDPRIAGIITDISELETEVAKLETEVAKNSKSILNVKYPPKNTVAPCVSDGLTDDTTALQNAINFAANNNMILYIPSKVLISDNISIPRGLSIWGCASTIPNYDKTAFSDISNLESAIITNNGSGFVIDNVWGGTIKNLAFVNMASTFEGTGLHLNRVRYWTFENLNIIHYNRGVYCTTNDPQINDDNTMYNTFINLSARCATCVELDGVLSVGGSWHGNCCHNTFLNSNLDATKVGMILKNCDNNTFVETAVFQRDGDWAIQLHQNCRANYFYHVQGRVLYDGCGSNFIWGYDRENGQPLPYAVSVTDINFFSARGNNYFINPTTFGICQMGGLQDDDWGGVMYPSFAFTKTPQVGNAIGVCKTDDNLTRYFGKVTVDING